MAIIRIEDFFSKERTNENFVFIFKSPPIKPKDGQSFEPRQVYVPVDATVREDYQLGSEITDNEVQNAEIISDHIHLQPQRISIKGIISESPVALLPAATQSLIDFGVNQSFNLLFGATGVRRFARRLSPVLAGFEKYASEFIAGSINASVFGTNDRKAAQKNFWEFFLKDRWKSKELFSVRSGLEQLDNVFFESISFNREYNIGNSLVFECTLKEVRVRGSRVIITNRPGGENHESEDRGEIEGKPIVLESLSEEIGETLTQTYPQVPVGSITKIENRIKETALSARKKVTDKVNNIKAKAKSFGSSLIRRIF